MSGLRYVRFLSERGKVEAHGIRPDGCAVAMWRLKGSDYQFRPGYGEPWKNAREGLPPREVIHLLNPDPNP